MIYNFYAILLKIQICKRELVLKHTYVWSVCNMKFIDVVSAVILCIVLYGTGNLGKQAVIKDLWNKLALMLNKMDAHGIPK